MVNEKYDVGGLCKAMPSKLQALVDSGGDKLSK